MKTDSQLYSEIMEKLEFDPVIDPAHITLSVHEGIVTLRGFVKHFVEKRAAEQAVRNVEGVQGIADELEINLHESLKRSDTDIAQAAIHTLQWNMNIPADKIKVTVADAKIKLTGDVEWGYQRQSAEKSLRNLTGIKEIDNQIKVKPLQPIASPQEIKEKILREFERNAAIDARKVQVETSGSKIVLKGQVTSQAEYKEANWAAWSIPGVTEVENQLIIDNSF